MEKLAIPHPHENGNSSQEESVDFHESPPKWIFLEEFRSCSSLFRWTQLGTCSRVLVFSVRDVRSTAASFQ